jgi:hypothetical protein
MSIRRCAVCLSSMVLAAVLWPAAMAGDDKPINVELKSFKFKVPDKLADLFGLNEDEGKLFFYTNGKAEAIVKVPAAGEYAILIKASGDKAKDERAKFKLAIDGKLIGKETELTADDVKEYRFVTELKAGERKLSIEFTNDEFKEGEYDRNLYVHGVTVKKSK